MFQCCISDQQYRIDGGVLLQQRQIGCGLDDLQWWQLIEVSENLQESHRRVAGLIDSNSLEFFPRFLVKEQYRGDLSQAGDAVALEDPVIGSSASFDLGDQPDIDGPVAQ